MVDQLLICPKKLGSKKGRQVDEAKKIVEKRPSTKKKNGEGYCQDDPIKLFYFHYGPMHNNHKRLRGPSFMLMPPKHASLAE